MSLPLSKDAAFEQGKPRSDYDPEDHRRIAVHSQPLHPRAIR